MQATLEGLIMGQINCGEAQVAGYHTVNRRYVYAALHWCTNHHAEICDTVRELMGAGVFQMPADVSVLENSDTRDAFETYWSVPGQSAKDRMKLFKLAWDLLGSDFAGTAHAIREVLRRAGFRDEQLQPSHRAVESLDRTGGRPARELRRACPRLRDRLARSVVFERRKRLASLA